jgi:N-acetylneuraminic acid mutarotase
MGGSSAGAEKQVTGTLGLPAIGNIPGARYQATTWTDKGGNFWLFGGENAAENQGGGVELNDLWEFNPSTNEWAWMAGSSTGGQPGVYGTLGTANDENVPGAREDASGWTDSKGNLWLFGGYGLDSGGTVGILNDLWEFNPSTGDWTWMSGGSTASSCFNDGSGNASGEIHCAQASTYGTLGVPAAGNTPGSRQAAITWTDNKGNLWLFGGWSFDVSVQVQYYFDELWEYNPSRNQWAWVGGSSTRAGSACLWNVNFWYLTCGEPGVYGTLGTPAPEIIPGGRAGAARWTDSQGNLWLFSGSGFDIYGYFGDPNDLWEFDSSTDQWKWMGGSNAIPPCTSYDCSAPPVYGSLGTPAAGNIPLGRDHGVSWTDSNGDLWLFGGGSGQTPDSILNEGMNDLWEFNPSSNQWALMGGSIEAVCGIFCSSSPEAVYGTFGIPAPGNGPGARFAPAGWSDGGGNFWLFGGLAPPVELRPLFYNDLWEYQPSTAALPTTAPPTFSVPTGSYAATQSVTISDATNGAFIYYTTDGTTPTINSMAFLPSQSQPISIEYSETLKAIAVASGCLPSAVESGVYTLPPQPATPTFSLPTGTYTYTPTVTISDATPGATIYYSTNGAYPTTSSTQYSGPITLTSGYTRLYAIATASGYSISNVAGATYALNLPWAAEPTFSVGWGTYSTPQTLTLSDSTPGATIYYQINTGSSTTGSLAYGGPITISSTESISAMATAPNYFPSGYDGGMYNINPLAPQTAAPTFNVPAGAYTTPQTVTISDATNGAAVYYTTDGSTPTTASTVYAGPIAVSSSEMLQAIAEAGGDAVSTIASATYTLNLPQAAVPAFSVPAGTYASAQAVTITDTTTGATIYYTTNGTTPTTSSAAYGGPITVSSTETMEAIATASGYAASNVASATYTISISPSFAVTGTAINLMPGATTGNTSTITLTPSGGFTGTISLSCAIAPTAASDPASCSIPVSVSISGSTAQTTTLTVNTTEATSALNQTRRLLWPSTGGMVLACILLVGIPARQRRWLSILGMLVLLLSVTCGVFACGGAGNGGGGGGGGGGGNSGTTAGNYTITVTGISGAITEHGTASLTVQ